MTVQREWPYYEDASRTHEANRPAQQSLVEVDEAPDGWSVVSLGDVAAVRAGGTPSRGSSANWGGAIPWVTTAEINGKTITETAEYITELGLERSSARLEESGTVLVALYGQGPTRGRVATLGTQAATNQACAAVVTGSAVLPRFLFHYLSASYERLRSLSNRGSQDNLSGRLLKAFPVLVPPLSEQRAIADALSDVDGLLAAQDALIAKKQDMMRAAMQQLLTGRTRLPGFSRKWETVRLGDHVTFLRNGTQSRSALSTDGPVRYLHYGDIHTSSVVRIDPVTMYLPSLSRAQANKLDPLRVGDLVFVDASEDIEGVGRAVEIASTGRIDMVAGLHTIAARFDEAVLADGFKAYLQFNPAFQHQLRRLAAGTKVYATTRAHISSVEMALPRTEEQTAIASVLMDLDAEMAALEARRDKIRMIKQGMMQQLLTGRVRLVQPGAAA